jgi:pimeloyl-ACP methyl ester carboxylesterase
VEYQSPVGDAVRVLLIITLVALASPSKAAHLPRSTVHVDDSVVEYRLAGSGQPLVVLEAGFGGDMRQWDKILPELSKAGAVFAYSRPGAGGSSASRADEDGIRTAQESARILKRTLEVLRLQSPYLLVGSSLGGLYVRQFAAMYPKDTAGIVLVDSRPPTFLNACRAAGVKTCGTLSTSPNPEWSPFLKATFIGVEPSETLAPTPDQLDTVPITEITATVLTDLPDSADFLRVWTEQQISYARLLKDGRQVFATGATHESLTEKDTDIVIREIEAMRSRLQQNRSH